MTTSEITQACLQFLTTRGWTVWRNNSGGRGGGKYHFGKPGSGDIIGYTHEGRFVNVEVKNPETGDKATQAQLDFHHHVMVHGGFSAIVGSLDDLKKRM